ncbi:nucleosidase [Corynebacterium mayonis]|uniref:nucleosidase n=1 Tax=Corynebacterium mayonis TaxID=3062461 RepID=UPI0031407E89
MSLLIVAAMKEEAAEITARTDHEVLVTGIGTVPATIALTKRLAKGPLPQRVVNVGTAGAVADMEPGVYEIVAALKHDHHVLRVDGLTDFVYPRVFHFEPVTDLPKASLATGDTFVNTTPLREKIASESDLVDMEGYCLAAVCSEFGVPLTLLKQVSDNADETSNISWPESLAAAAVDLHEALRLL